MEMRYLDSVCAASTSVCKSISSSERTSRSGMKLSDVQRLLSALKAMQVSGFNSAKGFKLSKDI
jgi:hypothetical protein